MKTFILCFLVACGLIVGCDDHPHLPPGGGTVNNLTKKHSNEIAVAWINMQQRLIKTTPGFDPIVAGRSFAYSGITLYESVVKGIPFYKSIVSPRIGTNINTIPAQHVIHWPSSANAAMASILRDLFANTSDANRQSIDSLETAFAQKYEQQTSALIVSQSTDYGRKIAQYVFDWSKTDGGHEAYLNATDDSYVPPTVPGKWIPTPPQNGKPIRPYWGDNRSLIANIATITMPEAPPVYSEDSASVFYKMAKEVYDLRNEISGDDEKMVKHWADLVGNYGTPAHYTHIATQLIEKEKLNLALAALTYVKHGIALNESFISIFKAKYRYNLIRPVSYIHNVIGDTNWMPVIGTPPHPEYPSAHSVLGGASYSILETIFGKSYSFEDHTHAEIYGIRLYQNLKAYAEEAARSRVVGGIHYNLSAQIGIAQGEKVAELVNKDLFAEASIADLK